MVGIKSDRKRYGQRMLAAAGVIGGGYLVLKEAEAVGVGVLNGMQICLQSVIPSLFIFMIIAEFISNTDLAGVLFYPFRLVAKLFRLPEASAPILAVSMIGGYPAGAKMVANLVRRGELSARSGEKLLCSAVNCSPSFLIGAVGIGIFHSAKLGGMLYLAQMGAMVVTGILAGVILKGGKEEEFSEPMERECDYVQSFVGAVIEAGKAVFMICCFVIVFAVAMMFCGRVPGGETFGGLLEVSVGCASLVERGFFEALILGTVYTSMGGVCVWMQIACFLRKTGVSIKKFIWFRCCYCFFSLGFTLLLARFLEITKETFTTAQTVVARNGSASITAAVCLVAMCVLLIVGRGRKEKERGKS